MRAGRSVGLALTGALLGAGAAQAQSTPLPTKDLAGARDPAGFKRYEGALIVSYERKAFTDIAIPLSALAATDKRDANNNRLFLPSKRYDGEGALTRVVYLAPADRSPLEVARNYEEDAKAKGAAVVFSCKGEACGGDAQRAISGGGGDSSLAMRFLMEKDLKDAAFSPGACATTSRIADQRYSAIKIPGDADDAAATWVAVLAYQVVDDLYCKAFAGRTVAMVHVLEPKGREQKMVTVSAAEMSKSLAQTGRVALYGVYFDTNKAEVKPESDAAIAEIGKLLTNDPKLSVLVVGHTDNVGGFDANLDLSRRRADAVIKTVASRHGVAPTRMRAAGVGMMAPVASNDDEAGRAKNRRVEIVKLN